MHIRKILKTIFRDAEFELDPPDLIVSYGKNISIIRYLVGVEANYGLLELSDNELKNIIDKYSVILDRMPIGSEIKIVKMRSDLSKIITKISNEILNLKATIDVVEEEHVRKKAEAKLRIVEKLYETILSGKPINRIILVVKLRTTGQSLEELKQRLNTTAQIIKSFFYTTIGIKLEEPDRRELEKIIRYELGLTDKPPAKQIIVENRRISHLLPYPPRKKPSYEKSGESIPIGVEIETGWPVLLPLDILNKHLLVIGPTGRGKTTLLANIIESLLALEQALTTAIDFKGDLVQMVPTRLLNHVRPGDAPVNLCVKPEDIDSIDWLLMVSDVLDNVMGIPRDKVVSIITKFVDRGEPPSPEQIVRDRDLSILAPIMRLVAEKPLYDKIYRLFSENTLFDLSSTGTAFQNTYAGILINLYRSHAFKQSSTDKVRLLVVDEAWRITGLQGLLELIKEGRSRNIGVVLAVQNPTDLPVEMIENMHTIIVFGSPNEEYRSKLVKILGLQRQVMSKIKYLSVGEALMINALDPHPIIIRIRPPTRLQQ